MSKSGFIISIEVLVTDHFGLIFSYGDTRDDYNERLAGFRLYKDSVRVFPYGRKGNDWLELDYMQNKERSVDCLVIRKLWPLQDLT